MEGGQKVATDKGAPQGGNLSPILANIYLHYVLDLWYAKRVRRQIPGYGQLVRYADDFICMVQNQQSAQELETMLHERFAKFGLTLHTEKTRVKSFGRYERTNAARQGRKSNTFDFLGFTHYCGTSRRGDFVVGRKTSSKKFRQKCRDMTDWLKRTRHILSAKDWWPILASKLRGHYQYYGVNGNSRMLSQFYYQTMLAVFRWLNRRSQRRSFTWQRFNAYVKRYPLPTPRIMCKLYKLSPVS